MSKFIQLNRIFTGIYLLFSSIIIGQISQNYEPFSLIADENYQLRTVLLPIVDVEQLLDEDERASHLKMLRFGYEHELNQEFLEESNVFLHNNKQILLIEYISYDAFAIRAIFEPFYLPEGVSLFVYNHDRSQIEGAYTSENNNDAMYFSTPLIEGEQIILELNVDHGVNLDDIQLNVSTIIHDYRGIIQMMENYSSTRQCGNDVMCEEAQLYINQINASAYLEMGGYICSGVMVNNMNEDLTPYFLTAQHCTHGSNPQGFRFYFNYYRDGCNDGGVILGEYAYSSILRSGCDCITGSYPNQNLLGPDFSLLQITDNIPIDWDVYYAGFNATSPIHMPISVGVHHPGGSPKRINYDSGSAISDYWEDPWTPDTHWYLIWDDGGTEGGSSGSPLFDDDGRIAGVLTGGYGSENCENNTDNCWYGKISKAWDWGDSPETRLKDWLDSDNTGELLLDGISNYSPMYIIGDVNGDEIINIQDIILVINFILGILVPVGDQLITSDVNLDYLINIQDILLIINIIINS